MPYQICMAFSQAEARNQEPDLSWDYSLHQAIFASEEADLFDLHLFYNLSDFYQDAQFLGPTVIGLRMEVEEARQRIQTPKATQPLSLLGKLCQKALKTNQSIFAFGE